MKVNCIRFFTLACVNNTQNVLSSNCLLNFKTYAIPFEMNANKKSSILTNFLYFTETKIKNHLKRVISFSLPQCDKVKMQSKVNTIDWPRK